MRTHRLEREQWFPRPAEEVFNFFGDAHNLDEITPPWLHFEVLTPRPIAMAPGTLIEYRLRLRGIRITWQTEITAWEPPVRFVDTQRRGPYRQWVHEHVFTPERGGTLMRDAVDYAVPGRILEPLVHRLFVAPDLRRIFDYRSEQLERRFRQEK